MTKIKSKNKIIFKLHQFCTLNILLWQISVYFYAFMIKTYAHFLFWLFVSRQSEGKKIDEKLMKKPRNIFEIWLLLNPWKLKYPASRANSMSSWNSARNFQGPKTPVTRRGFKLRTFYMYRSYLDLLCHMPCTISVLSSFSWSMR